jgi:hypothetical protein
VKDFQNISGEELMPKTSVVMAFHFNQFVQSTQINHVNGNTAAALLFQQQSSSA